ncbi:unnamed protein product [Hymenolepis diminuta]|uniref:Uncharacterized protein n=1 Tax=Hymenolepis diminuta TaxID=6216 RepID=A0A564ZB19_HYMDI|nr:unnamed protein product [Hymenolepis diminuta]
MVSPAVSQSCLHWPFLFLKSSRPIKARIQLYPHACPHPVLIINSLHQTHTNHTHTEGTLARQTHLPLLNPSPPIPYFPLRLCTELCSIQSGQRNPWCSFSCLYC